MHISRKTDLLWCTGMYSGDTKTALSLAKTNITVSKSRMLIILSLSVPGCAAMIKNEYPVLTAKEPDGTGVAEHWVKKSVTSHNWYLKLTPSEKKAF